MLVLIVKVFITINYTLHHTLCHEPVDVTFHWSPKTLAASLNHGTRLYLSQSNCSYPSVTIHIIRCMGKLYHGITCVGMRSESERGKEKKTRTEKERREAGRQAVVLLH